MARYRIEVDTVRPLPTMRVLVDAVAEELERHGLGEHEYAVEVHGPPELKIGLVMR